jgi:hypothetical protein
MTQASDQQVAQAQKTLARLRKEIARFHRLRRQNNEVIAGLRPGIITPDQAQMIAVNQRDPGMEQRAVDSLRTVIKTIAGHEPTAEEMAALIPEGAEDSLGWFPVAAAVAIGLASAGGAAISYFRYLSDREETIQEQTRGPVISALDRLASNTWALVGLAAIGTGLFVYWDVKKGRR